MAIMKVGDQKELKCLVERAQFVDKESGETRLYFKVSCVINGTSIKLSIPKESKQLFEYLINL